MPSTEQESTLPSPKWGSRSFGNACLLTFIVLLTLSAGASCAPAHSAAKQTAITLDFAGDCTFGSVNGESDGDRFPAVYRRAHEKDYPFALVRLWFAHDDLTIVNFECTLTDATAMANKKWHFKGPARYAAIFPAGGVEVVGLANNHSHDYLDAGFSDTLANFKKAHVAAFYQTFPI